MTPSDKLRVLLDEPAFVVMPAIWDGLTSKLSFEAGFPSAFLSGSCVAASRLGGPDLDLITSGEMLDSLQQARAAAPDLLILADGDHGYGNAMNVQRTVRAYGRAGAAAVLIEDKVTPRALTAAGKPTLPREEARMKIRAAVAAARESGLPPWASMKRWHASRCTWTKAPICCFSIRPLTRTRFAAPSPRRPGVRPSPCFLPARRGKRRPRSGPRSWA